MEILTNLLLISGLHILAVSGDCILGRDDIVQTSSNPTPGLFIDISNSAQCSGYIREWTICYYNPTHTLSNNLQIELQVWRFDESLQTGVHVGDNTVTVTVPDEPEEFQCVSVEVDQEKSINVTAGDFLGVLLFRDAVLPVVNNYNQPSGPAPTLVFMQASLFTATTINRGAPGIVDIHSNAIHVYADIAMFEDTPVPPTNTIPKTTPQVEAETTTSSEIPPLGTTGITGLGSTIIEPESTGPTVGAGPNENTPAKTGLGAGAIAAIVIVLLMLVAVLVTGTAIALILLARRRSRYKEEPPTQDAFDNAVYEHPEIHPNLHYAEGTGTFLSQASTYEVPLSLSNRHTLQSSLVPQPHLHPQGWGAEESGNGGGGGSGGGIYSTIDCDNGRVAATTTTREQELRREQVFADSFETEYTRSQDESDQKEVSGQFNPYSTLTAVNIDYYNTFFKQATSALYANPDLMSREIPFHEPPNNEDDIYKILKKRTYTISRKEIKTGSVPVFKDLDELYLCKNERIQKKIGEGAFSLVSKGTWTRMGVEYDVAIKALIKNSSEEDKIKLLQEAAIMGQFQHPNIVKLFGVIKQGHLPMLVTEFLHKGDLLHALQVLHPDPGQLVESETPSLLLSYSQQVALGMHYLSSKGYVHRDLAARNVFVTKDNICKVGDFGMSRELANTDYYVSKGGVVPVRWTAPEAIFYRKYSTASDVWSYGCLLYEIWTLGMRPYEGIATSKYLETLQFGYRLPPPPGCPKAVYSIMMRCWHPKTSERPNFGDILTCTLNEKEEVLSIPEKDALTHEQANCLGASLEAGLEMYKQLQNTYLAEQHGAAVSVKQKRQYMNLERPSPPPRVASKMAGEGERGGGKMAAVRKQELLQKEYEVEEGEENEYSVISGPN